MSFWRKLASSAVAAELFVDLLGLLALAFPLDPASRRIILTVVLTVTAAGSIGSTAYGYWLTPVIPGFPTPRQIRGIIFGGTLGSLVGLTGLALMWIPLGIPFIALMGVLWLIILVSTVADIVATYNILR